MNSLSQWIKKARYFYHDKMAYVCWFMVQKNLEDKLQFMCWYSRWEYHTAMCISIAIL